MRPTEATTMQEGQVHQARTGNAHDADRAINHREHLAHQDLAAGRERQSTPERQSRTERQAEANSRPADSFVVMTPDGTYRVRRDDVMAQARKENSATTKPRANAQRDTRSDTKCDCPQPAKTTIKKVEHRHVHPQKREHQPARTEKKVVEHRHVHRQQHERRPERKVEVVRKHDHQPRHHHEAKPTQPAQAKAVARANTRVVVRQTDDRPERPVRNTPIVRDTRPARTERVVQTVYRRPDNPDTTEFVRPRETSRVTTAQPATVHTAHVPAKSSTPAQIPVTGSDALNAFGLFALLAVVWMYTQSLRTLKRSPLAIRIPS